MGPHRYRIIVAGTLGEITRAVFEDLRVESHGANTWLTGELDQAGLYGVLGRIQAFGLELVAVSRLDDESEASQSRCKWRVRVRGPMAIVTHLVTRLRSDQVTAIGAYAGLTCPASPHGVQ